MVFTAIVMFYNTGSKQYHQGGGVNYHGKKFYNIGPRSKCHKTFFTAVSYEFGVSYFLSHFPSAE
jgi:hypothetical protein